MPRHKNNCPCERCAQRKAGLPVTAPKTVEKGKETEFKPSHAVLDHKWNKFDKKPRPGDQILYWSGGSEQVMLVTWTNKNEDNFKSYADSGSLWAGPIKRP